MDGYKTVYIHGYNFVHLEYAVCMDVLYIRAIESSGSFLKK